MQYKNFINDNKSNTKIEYKYQVKIQNTKIQRHIKYTIDYQCKNQ